MNYTFLVYKTDSVHSYASRDTIAITTDHSESLSFLKAIMLCHEQAEKEGEEINEDQIYNLRNLKQTQGYSGEGEFQIEFIETNKLL